MLTESNTPGVGDEAGFRAFHASLFRSSGPWARSHALPRPAASRERPDRFPAIMDSAAVPAGPRLLDNPDHNVRGPEPGRAPVFSPNEANSPRRSTPNEPDGRDASLTKRTRRPRHRPPETNRIAPAVLSRNEPDAPAGRSPKRTRESQVASPERSHAGPVARTDLSAGPGHRSAQRTLRGLPTPLPETNRIARRPAPETNPTAPGHVPRTKPFRGRNTEGWGEPSKDAPFSVAGRQCTKAAGPGGLPGHAASLGD
jgi:hypothetical protein